MGLFNRPTNPTPEQSHSICEVIENPGNNTGRGLIAWRHPSENFNTHAKLLVRAGEEAIFENGATEWAVFPERTECELQTQNIAVIRKFREALSGGKSYFPCRVYFISIEQYKIEWGTKTPIAMNCPLLGDGVRLRGNGEIFFKVVDSELFAVKLLRDNIAYTTDDLHEFLMGAAYQKVSALIAKEIKNSGFNALEVGAEKAEEISNLCIPALQELFKEFGIYVTNFTLAIQPDEEDVQEYKLQVKAQVQLAKGEAQARVIGAQGKVAEMNTMGAAYTTIKGMEMLQTIAENPGAGGVASAGAGIGMGMAAGNAFGNIAQSVFGGAMQRPQQPQQQNFGGQGRFGGEAPQQAGSQPDPIESLQKMKAMLDAGLITQEVYDNKVAEILSRI